MQSQQSLRLKEYKNLIETISKVEYQKFSAGYLIEYSEIVSIANQTLYNLFKGSEPSGFNNSYLSTAIKWAIRNEVRRRYKWYSQRNSVNPNYNEDLRDAVYKTILSIDELTVSESPMQIKDATKNPEESMEFFELRKEVIEIVKTLPQRERALIESKFFKDKKLKEISEEFNLSQSRASRIIQAGLTKIKQELRKKREEL